jgi:hypothetical protein
LKVQTELAEYLGNRCLSHGAIRCSHYPIPIQQFVILGLKSQLTKGAAREALQKEIATQTGQNLGGKIMKDGSHLAGSSATDTIRYAIGGLRQRK